MTAGGNTSGVAGRSILVTGGGSGIGLATAVHLASDGAHVTICGRTEEKLADAVCAHQEVAARRDATASFVVADVTVEEQVAGAVERTVTARAASMGCSPAPADRPTRFGTRCRHRVGDERRSTST